MSQVVLDLPPTVFSALRKAPRDLGPELRLAAAIHWYEQGKVSQERAAEVAGLHRVEFLDKLRERNVPAIQIGIEELREELRDEW